MNYFHRFVLLASLSIPVLLSAQEARDFREVVKEQFQRYPKLEIQDLYKLSLQASLGIEHFMSDTVAMFRYLNDELAQVDANDRDPLTESLTPDGQLVRLNLRPFKLSKGDPALLIRAMAETAKAYRGARKNMFAYWGTIELMAEERLIAFKKRELQKYFQKRSRERFPAVHHSAIYERTYHPAYRVVRKELVPSLFTTGSK
jgi:hypothetical protein